MGLWAIGADSTGVPERVSNPWVLLGVTAAAFQGDQVELQCAFIFICATFKHHTHSKKRPTRPQLHTLIWRFSSVSSGFAPTHSFATT